MSVGAAGHYPPTGAIGSFPAGRGLRGRSRPRFARFSTGLFLVLFWKSEPGYPCGRAPQGSLGKAFCRLPVGDPELGRVAHLQPSGNSGFRS